jgi:hypothetical protein
VQEDANMAYSKWEPQREGDPKEVYDCEDEC